MQSQPSVPTLFFSLLLAVSTVSFVTATEYDPMLVTGASKSKPMDLVVNDVQRSREIPIRVYLPSNSEPVPVILFSHGLGGSREGNPYLGEHWSARGYVVVFVQHAGSDEAVWKDVPMLQRMVRLKQAANLQNSIARFKDIPAVLDQLEKWNKSDDSPIKGRMNLNRIGMSGHSFGALTTQNVSGQRAPLGIGSLAEKRIKAAIAMSPNCPKGSDAKSLFGSVEIPWLLMTGTNDTAIVGDATVETRLKVYPALPAGGKYELVLDGGEHEAFSDRDLPGTKSKRNPNHHRIILALSTAFWDAWLREDASARAWIDGSGPASVLEPKDRWQHK